MASPWYCPGKPGGGVPARTVMGRQCADKEVGGGGYGLATAAGMSGQPNRQLKNGKEMTKINCL